MGFAKGLTRKNLKKVFDSRTIAILVHKICYELLWKIASALFQIWINKEFSDGKIRVSFELAANRVGSAFAEHWPSKRSTAEWQLFEPTPINVIR
jgi:hypothetical protein